MRCFFVLALGHSRARLGVVAVARLFVLLVRVVAFAFVFDVGWLLQLRGFFHIIL